MKHWIYLLLALSGGLGLQGCATSEPQHSQPKIAQDDTRSYFEVLRSDFNASKIRTLNDVMHLSDAEADKFWPLYRNYEKELAALSDRKLDLIRDFLAHSREGTLTQEKSKELAQQWLQNAQGRLDLWRKYHRQIGENVSPLRAAQFLQVENQMALFVDISIASEMPLIGHAPQASR